MAWLTSPLYKAIFFVLIAWLFFTGALALADHLGTRLPTAVLLLFQNGISLLCILPKMIHEGGDIWHPPRLRLLLLRSLAGYLNFAFLFLAIQYAPLTGVVLLGNSAPFFIPLIIWLWRGIRLSAKLWLGIIVGFIGIALILHPRGNLFNVGALFALAAAFCFSISMIAQRRLIKKNKGETILFYYFSFGALISLPFAISAWQPLNSQDLLLLTSIGFLSATGQLLLIKALFYEKPSLLSPFNYSAIVYSALIDWLIWKKSPHSLEVFGILIVIVGGVLTMRAAPPLQPPSTPETKP